MRQRYRIRNTRNYHLLLPATISLLIACLSCAMATAQGPISPTGLIGQKEIVLIWDEGHDSAENVINHQVASLITGYQGQPDLGERLEFGEKKVEEDGSYGDRQLDVASGDFNGDGLSDYVAATLAAGNRIRLRVPRLADSTLSYTSSETLLAGTDVDHEGDIRVLAGNFDEDEADEFVLAYRDNAAVLHIEMYDTDNTLLPALQGQVSDETLGSSNANGWDIDLHDLNGDGISEVIIGFRPSDPGKGVYVKVYRWNGSSFDPKARELIDNNVLTDNSLTATLAVTAGNLDGSGNPDLVLAWGRIDSCGGTGCDDTFLYPLRIGDDLETITFSYGNRASTNLSANRVSPLGLQSGDLNNDGIDEVVLGGSFGAEIFMADSTFTLVSRNSVGNYSDDLGYSVDFFRVADIDGQGGMEVVILDHYFSNEPNGEQYLTLTVHALSEELNRDSVIAREFRFESIPTGSGAAYRRHYGLAVGDFNGDNFRIGEGTRYVKTDVIQPLVILNAPPTHFDVLGTTVYDINSCYNENLASCLHTATYFKAEDVTKMVNTEVYSNWGLSAGLTLGASAYGIGAEAHLKATYGEKFSRTQGSSSTVQVSSEITASGDDLIYATVCDYEIWEYPVYAENNSVVGHIVALVPSLTENRWFPSKERSAAGYVPRHEVGNILSYTPYNDLENPELSEMLRGSYLNGSTDLNESTDATFAVNLQNTFTEASTRSQEIGLEVGGKIGGYGITVEGTASYQQGSVSTHSTSVSEEIDIRVHFGPVDRGLGETNFNVTPYVYWARNGALVVDYAARAILPSQGGTATWWSANYGIEQDPAFILPWRLDPEKGLALQDEERRRQTKSIRINPPEPSAGDTVTLTALVSNFSLIQTGGTVPVSFYLGNPDNGGELLAGLSGETLFYSADVIGAQGAKEVSMDWIVPGGMPAFPRIYAVIDPQGVLDEIHEDNNVGWTVMGHSEFSTGTDEGKEVPAASDADHLTRVYPNPFTGTFTLEFLSEKAGTVSVRLFDSRGSLVHEMEHEPSPGPNSIEIPAGNLGPGIYYYRFSDGTRAETRKVIRQ